MTLSKIGKNHTMRNKVIAANNNSHVLNNDYKEKYGFSMPENHVFKAQKGLDDSIVRAISKIKNEPEWMANFRLSAFAIYKSKFLPSWGPSLTNLDLNEIYYYLKSTSHKEKTWEEVPEDIKNTFNKLGIPQAEQKYLSGVEAQYDSEAVYGSLKQELTEQGIIFCDTDTALKKYPELFKEWFGKIVSPNDNKFAALNSAVWSGGSFVYIPKGVKVSRPIQAYFRINAKNMGQFERTLIIADEGSFVNYVEGCTAPMYSEDSLHAAVVEVVVKRGARVRYTTIQNWSTNVYNLVTKRARVDTDGIMEWVDGNLGSKVTMKYPSCYLVGEHAHGEVLSLAYAGKGQIQDTGAKMIHLAPNTTSLITSKSICVDGGVSNYRGLVKVHKGAVNSKSRVECEGLILDKNSEANSFPVMQSDESYANLEHEAFVKKIDEEKSFYLASRGLQTKEAENLIVSGFIEPIVKELPMEYALELNQLIQMSMKG